MKKLFSERFRLRLLLIVVAAMFCVPKGNAVSFALDSIAEWGKFPRFCINVYRWGDKFFNSYDSAYVVGTGTKFNVKVTTDSWLNYYRFTLPDAQSGGIFGPSVDLISRPSTSVGVHLTYLAVSIGYDLNLSSLFRGIKESRQRYQFGFSCALFTVEAYKEINRVGTRMTRFGSMKHLNIPFDGMHSDSWGIDLYYFFNNKKYSQAAAFNYSKIQRRSQGSFFAGLSVYSQKYDFDFSGLDRHFLEQLPSEWEGYHFATNTQNYGIRAGYAYNWVFAKNLLLGVSVSPTVGLKHGYVNSYTQKTSFSLYNHAKLSVVWNGGKWFAGINFNGDTAVVSDRQTTFMGSNLSFTAAAGYRFNLW